MRNYWWPEITKDVGKYVEGYNMCQRMKNRMEVSAGKLMVNEVPEKTNASDSRLYHQVTVSGRKRCNTSSM